MIKQMIIDYFKEKSVFKFDVINDEKLLNVLQGVELIMVVKKENNYMMQENKKPMMSLVLKDKSSFIKYVKYTNYYELNKLSKLKLLNAFRPYCKENNLLEDYYADDMLITITNIQQFAQSLIIDKKISEINKIISGILKTNSYELKIDDTPLIKVEVEDEFIISPSLNVEIKDQINDLLREEMAKLTEYFDDILVIEIDKKEKNL